MLVEFARLLVVIILLKLIGAVLAHAARLRHSSRDLVQRDGLLDELEVPLRVVLLHAEGGLLEMIGLEAVVGLALDALEVHLHGLVRVLRVLIAVGGLLVEILGVVLAVLLRRKHVAEEAALECRICLRPQLLRLYDEVCRT